MADKMKSATCPICGYVESSTDADALQSEMQEHMQSAHNMSWTPDADIKQTATSATDDAFNSPLVPPSAVGGLTNGPLH